MDDVIDVLEKVRSQKNWSQEVFVEKVAEFAAKHNMEDELVDFMLSCETESISEDVFQVSE
jgi:hypothetical protein